MPANDGRKLMTEPRFYHRSPRYEAETHAVVKHGETAADELELASVDATGLSTVMHRSIGLAGLVLQCLANDCQLSVAQGDEQVPREHDTLATPLGQAMLDEEVHAVMCCLSHLGAEALGR